MAEQQRSLVKKLAEIMLKVKYIEKKGYNQKQNYKYFRDEDLLEAVREEFASRNLVLFPNTKNIQVIEAGKSGGGTTKFLTTIEMELTVEDGDSGEMRTVTSGGQGIDTGDKGIYKATTGAVKYGIVKLLQIPTGDDPEKDDEHNGNYSSQQPQQQPRNNNSQQRQPQGSQSGQRGSQRPQMEVPTNGAVDALRNMLGWTPDQMIKNVNVWLATYNKQPIGKWAQLDPEGKCLFYGIMKTRYDKMTNGGK